MKRENSKMRFKERRYGMSAMCPHCHAITKIGNLGAKIKINSETNVNLSEVDIEFNPEWLFCTKSYMVDDPFPIMVWCPYCKNQMFLVPTEIDTAISDLNDGRFFTCDSQFDDKYMGDERYIRFYNICVILSYVLKYTNCVPVDLSCYDALHDDWSTIGFAPTRYSITPHKSMDHYLPFLKFDMNTNRMERINKKDLDVIRATASTYNDNAVVNFINETMNDTRKWIKEKDLFNEFADQIIQMRVRDASREDIPPEVIYPEQTNLYDYEQYICDIDITNHENGTDRDEIRHTFIPFAIRNANERAGKADEVDLEVDPGEKKVAKKKVTSKVSKKK